MTETHKFVKSLKISNVPEISSRSLSKKMVKGVSGLTDQMTKCTIAKWNKKTKREWAKVKKECPHCHKKVRQGDMAAHKKSKRCRLIKRRLKAQFKKMMEDCPDRPSRRNFKIHVPKVTIPVAVSISPLQHTDYNHSCKSCCCQASALRVFRFVSESVF